MAKEGYGIMHDGIQFSTMETATTEKNGLMSAQDKQELIDIEQTIIDLYSGVANPTSIVTLYADLIVNGRMTEKDVPEEILEDVQTQLSAKNYYCEAMNKIVGEIRPDIPVDEEEELGDQDSDDGNDGNDDDDDDDTAVGDDEHMSLDD